MTRRTVAALLLAGAASGCGPRAAVPMRTVEDRVAAGRARSLIVFLPGRGSRADTFVKEDFAAIAREGGVAADLVFADATEGYYADRTIVERLHDDVVAPARSRGYERVWLVGTSLGGLGAILYAREHPGDVDGVLLLAPYLGEAPLVEEIERTGGLAAWRGPYAGDGWNGVTREVWAWLRDAAAPGARRPELWLGYGRSDRLRRSHALLAAALAPGRVLTADGGHAWPVWRELWRAFVATPALSAPRAE